MLIPGVANADSREGVQDPHDTPRVHLGAPNSCQPPAEVGLNLEGPAGPAHPEIQMVRIPTGHRPLDLAGQAKLRQKVSRLNEIRPGRRAYNLTFESALFPVRPEIGKGPPGMIQQQPREGKQPYEKQQIKAEVVMNFPAPEFEPVGDSPPNRF